MAGSDGTAALEVSRRVPIAKANPVIASVSEAISRKVLRHQEIAALRSR